MEIMKMWIWRNTSKRDLDDITGICTDSSIMEFTVFLSKGYGSRIASPVRLHILIEILCSGINYES